MFNTFMNELNSKLRGKGCHESNYNKATDPAVKKSIRGVQLKAISSMFQKGCRYLGHKKGNIKESEAPLQYKMWEALSRLSVYLEKHYGLTEDKWEEVMLQGQNLEEKKLEGLAKWIKGNKSEIYMAHGPRGRGN